MRFALLLLVNAFGANVPAESPTLEKGRALYAEGRYDASLSVLRELTASPEVSLYMGLNYAALRDHGAAQKRFEEAWNGGAREPYLLYSLIEEDHALGDKAAGMEHYRLFLKEFPDSPWLHVLYANAYFLKDKDTEARAEYEEALRLSPRLATVHFRLGYLMYKNNEFSGAAEHFKKELDLNPSYSDACLFLGQSLRQLGREDEALAQLNRAISLGSPSELAYSAVVGLLTDKGDLSRAAEILTKAEAQFPQDPRFPAQRARVLAKLDRNEEAAQAQERSKTLMQAEKSREKQVVAPQ